MDHDHYCSAIEAKELGLVDHLTLTLTRNPNPSPNPNQELGLVDHIVQGKGHFSAEPRAEPAPEAREASAATGA